MDRTRNSTCQIAYFIYNNFMINDYKLKYYILNINLKIKIFNYQL